MNIELRREALEIARQFSEAGNIQNLIDNARKIEQHLLGQSAESTATFYVNDSHSFRGYVNLGANEPGSGSESGMDFNDGLRTCEDGSSQDWSGTAQDLARIMNSGSTLVCKARNIGMTTFLIEFAVAKLKQGKHVLWFSGTGRQAMAAEQLILDKLKGEETVDAQGRFDWQGLNTFDTAAKGRTYDYIIVDGLASLPYSKETNFISSVMPMSEHFIFSSEPSQARGLFYDMWQNSTSFRKVILTWHQPLFPQTEARLKQIETLKSNLGEDRFKSEFECVFREITE